MIIRTVCVSIFFVNTAFFIALVGEYIMNVNTRIMNRILVIEKKGINFDRKQGKEREVIGEW